jgi:hypothetical protein
MGCYPYVKMGGEGVAHERGWLVAVEWMKLPLFINGKILRAEHTSFVLFSVISDGEKEDENRHFFCKSSSL